MAKPKGYRQLLQLIGHEYLHQWNVRRLRPVALRPYDYGQAVITEGLWFAEGITSYYALSLPLLAGRSDRPTLLKDLGEELSSVLMSPGCSVQSLAASAREAWIKLYKATPASRDTQISYYRLGAAVAFCLDVRLRQRGLSMAAILRELWLRLGRQARGYSRHDIKAALAQWEADLAADLDQWLDQPEALPLIDCVEALGLRMDPVPLKHPDHGLTLKDGDGAALIQRVRRQSPGQRAGLVVGDELLAINGYRVRRGSDLPSLLD